MLDYVFHGWMGGRAMYVFQANQIEEYLTIRPVALKGYGSIAHEAKPNGLLARGP